MDSLKHDFTVWDYLVFIGMLVVSMGIGIYFAFKGDGQKTQGEYLMGGRTMKLIPVSISILVSFQSAILMLGTPAEMYTQGTEYYISVFGQALGYIMAGIFFVPLLYPLGFTSAFEYLEKRYKSKMVRYLGTLIMIIGQITYMGIASYAPATAFEEVTGFPVMATLFIIGAVATFYTTIGGMKAVVWTDVFQAGVMLAGVLSIVVQATIKLNGVGRVWEINKQWDRVHFFTWNPDPLLRHNVWGLIIGNCLYWMITTGLNQAAVQRYCSLPTLTKAKATTWINSVCVFVLFSLTCFSGMVLFAYYASKNCDPLGEGIVDNSNQLIPLLVMEILAYPAIPGLFMSSLFSGALSSISSSLNSLAALTWEDILKPQLTKQNLSELKKTVILKVLVVAYGLLAIVMSYMVTFIEGTVVQAATSLLGPINGAIGGLFILGAVFPFANKYGAIIGGCIGMAVSMWRSLGAYNIGIEYRNVPYPNGTCLDGNYSVNASFTTPLPEITTTIVTDGGEGGPLDYFYKISYMWAAPLSLVGCLVPGLIISLATRCLMTEEEKEVPTKYQIPIFTRLLPCLPESWLYTLNCYRDFESTENTPQEDKNEEHYIDNGMEQHNYRQMEEFQPNIGVVNSGFEKDEPLYGKIP